MISGPASNRRGESATMAAPISSPTAELDEKSKRPIARPDLRAEERATLKTALDDIATRSPRRPKVSPTRGLTRAMQRSDTFADKLGLWI